MHDKEYDYLLKRLDYSLTTRIAILTFSFTTVLAVIGLAISNVDICPYVYLLPYGLIIPFTARIIYYRLVHAQISAFLAVFAPEKMQFTIKSEFVPEGQTKFYPVIAALVNYEMAILAFLCAIVFYNKYLTGIKTLGVKEYFICSVPLLLESIVIAIIAHGYNYTKHYNRYKDKWMHLFIDT